MVLYLGKNIACAADPEDFREQHLLLTLLHALQAFMTLMPLETSLRILVSTWAPLMLKHQGLLRCLSSAIHIIPPLPCRRRYPGGPYHHQERTQARSLASPRP